MKRTPSLPATKPIILITVVALFTSVSSFGDTISMGTVLPQYAIVSVGPNASLTVNSGPVNGKVLIGDGSNATSSGGNNGQITGGVFVSGTATGDNLQGLQFAPTVTTLPASVGVQAFNDAATLSANAAGLTPNLTVAGTFSGAITIHGQGGMYVVDFNSLQNPTLTIKGSSKDTFIFNVSGFLNTNIPMTLIGVNASQILWNFTGTSGNIFQTSGGDVLFGTFLATHGGDFQFSNLNLTGELINTGGHIQDVSGSYIPTFSPLTPPPVPEPGSIVLLGTGLAGLVGAMRRKRQS